MKQCVSFFICMKAVLIFLFSNLYLTSKIWLHQYINDKKRFFDLVYLWIDSYFLSGIQWVILATATNLSKIFFEMRKS